MSVVELRGVTKRFAGVVANDNITFTAHGGEVHALLGENGAGKSTLMSILAGLYRPDEGSITIDDQELHFRSPRDAIQHGIGMVYQHFMLVDSFTVAENMMLGQQGRGVQLDTAEVERELAELGRRYRLQINPRDRVWQLSVGEQQRVEIVRLLYRGAKVLIFDEPTAVLTPQESAALIETLRHMAAEGFCIIFISHKLDEVLAVADRITVLRRGRVVTTVDAKTTDRRELARLMVGREVVLQIDRPPHLPEVRTDEVVLELRDLHAVGAKGLPALNGINLTVRAGEIVGVAGVAGNGQRELAEVITGLRRATTGQVVIDNRDMTGRSPRALVAAGVAHIPEDRNGMGLIPSLELSDNLILKDYRNEPLSRGPVLQAPAVVRFTEQLLQTYQVAAPSRHVKARLLSGGNQQKLLLARELSGVPRLIVAVHPTRGVDIGATEAIQRLLLDQRARGAAILLISEDLDELLALSDRVAVLYEGRLMATVPAADADIEHIGLLMAGGTVATNEA